MIELMIVILFILLALTILYALYYYGLFSNIEIKAGNSPYNLNGKLVLFKIFKGTIKDIGPNFTKLSYLLMPFKSSSLIPICIQYRSLHSVKPNLKPFKYLIGVIMEEENEDLKSHLLLKNYKLLMLPSVEHVVSTTFPNKGSISIVIALNRVYPLLESYIKEHVLCAHPLIELYKNDQILFIIPLSKQELFYLLDENESDEENEFLATEEKKGYGDISEDDKQIPSSSSSTTSSFEQLVAEELVKNSCSSSKKD